MTSQSPIPSSITLQDPGHQDIFDSLIATAFSADEFFVLQYTKLVNYFGDQLCLEWGGDFCRHRKKLQLDEGLRTFMHAMQLKRDVPGAIWIHRVSTDQPWEEYNVVLKHSPSPELGVPEEAYFSMGGGLIRAEQACRLLCLKPRTFIELKLRLIADTLVADEAIRLLLKPKALWDRAQKEQLKIGA